MAIQQLQNFPYSKAYELRALVLVCSMRPLAKDEYVTIAHEAENVVNNNNWNILHGSCPVHAAYTHAHCTMIAIYFNAIGKSTVATPIETNRRITVPIALQRIEDYTNREHSLMKKEKIVISNSPICLDSRMAAVSQCADDKLMCIQRFGI